MDEAPRIPIDIDVPQAAVPGEPTALYRETVLEDGTVRIDILVPHGCAPASNEEIVVCAPAEGMSVTPVPPPSEPTLMERVGEALHFKIGPVELGSIPTSEGARAIGARVRF